MRRPIHATAPPHDECEDSRYCDCECTGCKRVWFDKGRPRPDHVIIPPPQERILSAHQEIARQLKRIADALEELPKDHRGRPIVSFGNDGDPRP